MVLKNLNHIWMVNRTLVLNFTPKSRTKIGSGVFSLSFTLKRL
jgi:hypothetical protein